MVHWYWSLIGETAPPPQIKYNYNLHPGSRYEQIIFQTRVLGWLQKVRCIVQASFFLGAFWFYVYRLISHTYIHAYIQTDRQRHADRQTDRQTCMHACIHTNIHTYTYTYTYTYASAYAYAYIRILVYTCLMCLYVDCMHVLVFFLRAYHMHSAWILLLVPIYLKQSVYS